MVCPTKSPLCPALSSQELEGQSLRTTSAGIQALWLPYRSSPWEAPGRDQRAGRKVKVFIPYLPTRMYNSSDRACVLDQGHSHSTPLPKPYLLLGSNNSSLPTLHWGGNITSCSHSLPVPRCSTIPHSFPLQLTPLQIIPPLKAFQLTLSMCWLFPARALRAIEFFNLILVEYSLGDRKQRAS